jgi:hypothetical protein
MKSKFHGVSDEQLLKERSNLARRLAACRGALTDLEVEIFNRKFKDPSNDGIGL